MKGKSKDKGGGGWDLVPTDAPAGDLLKLAISGASSRCQEAAVVAMDKAWPWLASGLGLVGPPPVFTLVFTTEVGLPHLEAGDSRGF